MKKNQQKNRKNQKLSKKSQKIGNCSKKRICETIYFFFSLTYFSARLATT